MEADKIDQFFTYLTTSLKYDKQSGDAKNNALCGMFLYKK